MTFAYCLALASRSTHRVTVLDWGGGLGFSYLLSRALLSDEVELEYHCKEIPSVCQAGRAAVPEVSFCDDDACFERTYDFVVASSSLQYCEDWTGLLQRLARSCSGYLLLTRVPVVQVEPSFVVLQRAPAFRTECLSWVFNRHELLDTASRSGVTLVREFLLGYQPVVVGAPEQDETRAYLFRATTPDAGVEPLP
jgi:putative methyltransferase (TIGR04325 family)